jgi:hypothetical protein
MLHQVSFASVPPDVERQSMAYFGSADPDTILEPIVKGKSVEKHVWNRIELQPGMRIAELSRLIIRGIYGAGTGLDGKPEGKERVAA